MADASATRAPPMTARDALAALGDLPRYEESLNARTGGLTLMLWGLATAGIFLTYAAAARPIERADAHWAFALLWMPWVAAGSWATALLWRHLAVTLRRDPDTRSGVRLSVLITLLFIALAAALFGGLDVVAGVEWTVHSLMAMASGLCALLVGVWQRRAWGVGGRNLAVAGLAMVAAAVALGLSGLGDAGSGLVAAAVVGSGWFAAGVATYCSG